jgi:hypothetical protein
MLLRCLFRGRCPVRSRRAALCITSILAFGIVFSSYNVCVISRHYRSSNYVAFSGAFDGFGSIASFLSTYNRRTFSGSSLFCSCYSKHKASAWLFVWGDLTIETVRCCLYSWFWPLYCCLHYVLASGMMYFYICRIWFWALFLNVLNFLTT